MNGPGGGLAAVIDKPRSCSEAANASTGPRRRQAHRALRGITPRHPSALDQGSCTSYHRKNCAEQYRQVNFLQLA